MHAVNWLEETSSDFIVRACQFLPESCAYAPDRIRIPNDSSSHLQTRYNAFCGSSEEFYIRPVNQCIDDVDALLYNVDELAFVEDFPVLPNDVSHVADSTKCFKIEPYFIYPGFVRLHFMGIMLYNWISREYDFRNTTFPDIYYSCDMSFYEADQLLTVELRDQLPTIKRGPALRVQNIEFATYAHVHSVWCPQWPQEAQDWLTRRRDYGWPTIDVISEVVQQGCHTVYVQHRACREDALQWRFSFSLAEVILIQSWTKIQQIVYHLFIYFFKREIIQTNCSK